MLANCASICLSKSKSPFSGSDLITNGEHYELVKVQDYKEGAIESPPGTSLLSAQVESHLTTEVPKVTSEVFGDFEPEGGILHSILKNSIPYSSVYFIYLVVLALIWYL